MEIILSWIASIVVSLWIGSYFSPYLRERAKNLATKDDFKDLREQTSELRRTTKEIEAKIEDQLWNRQRQWEIKRDLLLKFAYAISDFEQAVLKISVRIEDHSRSACGVELFNRAMAEWNEASDRLSRDQFVVGLVVCTQTRFALLDLSRHLREVTTEILRKKTIETYRSNHKDIVAKLEAIKSILSKELGFATSNIESTGSSLAE